MIRKLTTIYYDDDSGEMAPIQINKRFLREPTLLQLDVIGDLHDAAREVLHDLNEQLTKELKALRKKSRRAK